MSVLNEKTIHWESLPRLSLILTLLGATRSGQTVTYTAHSASELMSRVGRLRAGNTLLIAVGLHDVGTLWLKNMQGTGNKCLGGFGASARVGNSPTMDSVSADADFSVPNIDFSPAQNSALIEAGTVAYGVPATDFNGQPRP